MKGIQGKVCVITGGAAGIGKATASAVLEHGSAVAIFDVDEKAGNHTEQELQKIYPGAVKFYQCDTSNEAQIEGAFEYVARDFGGATFLVNGAARFIMKGVEAGASDWQNVLATNVTGYSLCAKYAARQMIRLGGGAIVNICSISAFVAQSEFLTYNVSKGAVATMTKCMALDLAKHKIRVNAVSPGSTWTDSCRDFHRNELGMSRQDAENDPNRGGKHVLQRYADPEEIASPILFLLSDLASFITGANLLVDGGYTIV